MDTVNTVRAFHAVFNLLKFSFLFSLPVIAFPLNSVAALTRFSRLTDFFFQLVRFAYILRSPDVADLSIF